MSDSRKVVITGVSRGLGRAMVDGFIRLGWTVTGCCLSDKAVEELRQACPAPHAFERVDVANDAEVAAFCEGILASQGAPDLVLNNAAIINPNAPLWQISPEDIASILNINIKGTIAMIRGLAPAMISRGSGVIVNFSSGWGRSASPEVAPYCATKWAIEGLSQAAAQETGGKIAIVALNPGIINTEMLRSCFGEAAASYPDALAWAEKAVPFLAALTVKDNGKALTAP